MKLQSAASGHIFAEGAGRIAKLEKYLNIFKLDVAYGSFLSWYIYIYTFFLGGGGGYL